MNEKIYISRVNVRKKFGIMAKYASIKINESTKKKADRLMKKFSLNGLDFYDAMVKYFELTGLNPINPEVLSPAEEIKKMRLENVKLRNDLIGFIKEQEKQFIKPLAGKITMMIAQFAYYLKYQAPMKEGAKMIGEETEEDIKQSNEVQESKRVRELEVLLEQEKNDKSIIVNHLKNMVNKADFKATGMSKKLVVEMTRHEFDSVKSFIQGV